MVIDDAPRRSTDDTARKFPGVMHMRLFVECDLVLVLVLKVSDEPQSLVKRLLQRYALPSGILPQHRLNVPKPRRRQSIARKCRPHFHQAQLSEELEFSHAQEAMRDVAVRATKNQSDQDRNEKAFANELPS